MIVLGTTLFSFTNEWLTENLTLPQTLRRMAERDLGPALEVVGFQSFRGFPYVDPDDLRAFRRQVDLLGLQPTALGVYADLHRCPHHPMTAEQALAYLRPQLDAAVLLGFPMLRVALGMELQLMTALVPELERRGLTLTLEVQGPAHPHHDPLLPTLQLLDRLQTPALGLTLDFSLTMTALPPSLLDHWRRLGVTAAVEQAFTEAWRAGQSPTGFAAAAEQLGAPAALITEIAPYLVRFGHTTPELWRAVLPWVRHAHAKYWDLEDADTQVAGPHAAMLQLLSDNGYHGAVLSEWGGSGWLETTDVDAFDITGRHLQLLRRELQRPSSLATTSTR